jgi:membrane-associated phospholipid phosphatase
VAAADQAAHDVLLALYPTFQASLDGELQQDLAQIPDGKPKSDGIAVGQTVAAEILAFRANDGSGVTPPPFQSKKVPGFYQSTPPDFTPADFTQWGDVTPFAIVNAREFLPDAPPALTDKEYIQDLAEVRSIGEIDSTTRTPDQTVIGKFWGGKIQNYWNEITQTAALAHDLTTAQNARLFALLNLSFADAVIAFYDAKYSYNFWRPVTAIRAAATDGNPDTEADPNWLPEVGNTAPDPSYPGAHAVISAAGAEVLISFFHKQHFDFDVTSEVLSGVVRSFTSFPAAAEEATLSRIFAGQHFLFDLTTGQRLGDDVADFVVDNFLTSRDRDD